MPKAKKSDSASEGLSHQDKFYRRNPLFLALAESLVELTTEGTIEEGPEGQKFMGDVMADLDQAFAQRLRDVRGVAATAKLTEGELETYNNVLEEWNLVLNAGDMYISAAAAGESDRRIDMSMATLHAVDTKLAVKGGPTLRTKK